MSGDAAITVASDADPDIAVVRAMLRAWDELDWDGVADSFTQDGIFHPMTKEPIVGREAIRARVTRFGAGVDKMDCAIKMVGRIGDLIVMERVDSFTYRGNAGSLAAAAFFRVEDGLIREWREYYDEASMMAIVGKIG